MDPIPSLSCPQFALEPKLLTGLPEPVLLGGVSQGPEKGAERRLLGLHIFTGTLANRATL